MPVSAATTMKLAVTASRTKRRSCRSPVKNSGNGWPSSTGGRRNLNPLSSRSAPISHLAAHLPCAAAPPYAASARSRAVAISGPCSRTQRTATKTKGTATSIGMCGISPVFAGEPRSSCNSMPPNGCSQRPSESCSRNRCRSRSTMKYPANVFGAIGRPARVRRARSDRW